MKYNFLFSFEVQDTLLKVFILLLVGDLVNEKGAHLAFIYRGNEHL